MVETPPIITNLYANATNNIIAKDVVTNITGLTGNATLGQLLAGKVLEQQPNGKTILQTNNGVLNFQSPLILPKSSQIVLKVIQQNNTTQAKIVTIDGKSPKEFLKQQKTGAATEGKTNYDKDSVVLPKNYEQPKQSLENGRQSLEKNIKNELETRHERPENNRNYNQPTKQDLLTKDVVKYSSEIQIKPGGIINSSIAKPDLLAFKVIVQEAPEEFFTKIIPQDAPKEVKINVKENVLKYLQEPEAKITTKINNFAPNITEYSSDKMTPKGEVILSKDININNQKISLPVISSADKAINITGYVLNTEGNKTNINTAIGSVQLETNLPKGSFVEFTITSLPIATQQTIPSQATNYSNNSVQKLFNYWQTLDESFQFIVSNAKSNSEDILFKNTPAADKFLASNLLKYSNIIKHGQVQDLIGEENIKLLLDNGKADLLRGLERDFSTIKTFFNETHQGWNTLLIPVLSGGKLFFSHMFIYDDEEANEQNAEKGIRFLIETDLDKLGNIQMDGLFKNTSPKKQFDLIMRSHEVLPENVKNDIIDIFTNTIEATGINGIIKFQNTNPFPTSPLKEVLNSYENSNAGSIVV